MKHFARLATLSFTQRRVVKYAKKVLFIAACCITTFVNVHGQSVFPVGSTPPELTEGQIILDTLRIDSVTAFTNDTFLTKPNILLANHFFPGYSGTDPEVWGPLVYFGHTFNITFEGDPDYFATFPSQPTLLKRQYSLKIFAPGDTLLGTPVFQDDSIFLVMNSATPRVDYRVDLSGLFAKYLPIRALHCVDSLDSTAFVADLIDSISLANQIGEDSLNFGGTRLAIYQALQILDSANIAARGIGASLTHSQPMFYTLTYITGGSSAYGGFSVGSVMMEVTTGFAVTPSAYGGGILPSTYGSGGVPNTSTVNTGSVIAIPYCPTCPCSLSVTSHVLSNPVQLNWSDCPFVNYEIQVLRLYNTDAGLTSDPHDIEAKIDWSQALDIETNNGQTSVKLTLAEGSGYYVWRVRRIADAFPNTIGDDRNWGAWTSTGPFVDGAVVSVDPTSPTAAPYFFYYDVFDDTLNYIYYRQFVEGETKHMSQFRVGEKTTFANYLLMPVQEQVKAQTADSILASQTLPDNNGRPMMQTMSATVGKNGFGYEYDYIKNSVGGLYTSADFDEPANYKIPSLVNGASKLVWYYSDANPEAQVPACDSIPFSRTLNYNDPLNRPKEIVSPGKYHNFGSGHTIKKYYCGTTTTELVRIFGDEAPRSESVLKTYTLDQNQVLSVTYTDKVTDKVLATCLSAPQSELLDEIESDPFTVYDTVTAKTPGYMPSRLLETKTYTFPLPTTLSYLYTITADVIGDSCAGLCATCDYIVTLSCRDIEDSNASHMFRDTLLLTPVWDTSGSMACGPVVNTKSGVYSVTPIGLGSIPSTSLEGTYVVSATILLGNKNPLTGRTYLRELDTLLVRKLHNRLMTTGGSVIGGYSGVTLTNIYSYLAGNNMDGLLTYTGADTTQPTFDLVVGCDTFTLPTDHCPKHSCTVIDFAEYMVAQLAQYDVDHGTSTYSGVSDINDIVDAPNHLFWVQDDAHFNQVIFNMIDSGYNCDTLWNCWVSTVDWFAAAQHHNVTTFPGAPMMDWWQHFMDLAEYKLPFTPRPTSEFGSGAPTTTYIHQAPFRYFPYNLGSNTTAEDAFCYLYHTEYLSVTPGPSFTCTVSTTAWMGVIDNYPTHLATSPFHMYNFYLSIKPSSTTYMTALTGTGLGSFGGGTPATYASMSDACYRMCDSRYNLIATEVADKYMKERGIYIEGPPYMGWYPDPPRDTMELSHVYCIASALVGKCKEGCVLTPDPATGVVPSSQMLAYQKSMTYSMKFLVTLSDTSGPCGVSYGGEHDSVISVTRDSLYFNGGGWVTHYYSVDSIIMVVGDSSIIDSSYESVCNADTNYSYNQAMLDWLNNRYMQIYDSMRAPHTYDPYDWYFMASPGMSSFGGAGFGCAGDYVRIRALSPPGHFSYDTLRTTTTTCTSQNFTVTRTKPRKAFINSTMPMEVDVVLTSGGALASGDSIVVIENIPATGTVVSTNGQKGTTTIRFAAGGPMAVGGVIKFRYDILMPSVTGTDVVFGGSVVRYTYSVTPSSCAMVADTTTADTCMDLFFVPGGTTTDPISPLCTSCWSPMDCHACICFHYEHPSPTAATDSVHVFTCAETVCSTFVNSLNTQVRNIKDKHCEILKIDYERKCNDPDNIKDMFVNSFELDHFQYTLYYYDRAGNLIRTVAPRGVLDTGTGRYAPVGHYDYDVTKYEYNTLGQLERQTTPDGGTTVFAYDKRGKVRLSQNAKQFTSTPSKVSYTMYDPLARVVEAGQLSNYGMNALYPYADTLKLNDITFPLPTGSGGITYSKEYITKTVYNSPCTVTFPGGSSPVQTFINNRISYTVTDRDGSWGTTADQVYNIYSYDPHGNVKSMWVYIVAAPNAMVVNYEYDLLSNKVTRVWHHKLYAGSGLSFTMPGIEDYLETQYRYDADKRLMQVFSAFQPGGVNWLHTRYYYYTHGPLKRTELHGRTQGVDYTYTLQGWLKAINHPRLLNQYDPGGDSVAGGTGVYSFTSRGKDIFGMVLNYYPGDFNRTGSAFNSVGTNNLQLNTTSAGSLGGGPLYNGNITSQAIGFWMQTPGTTDMHDSLFYQNMSGNTYRYDQLNRITKSRFWYYNGTWARPAGTTKPYDETFTYDKNGNLTSLGRTFKSPSSGIAVLDDLSYDYNWSGIQSNRLEGVNDIGGIHSPLKDKGGLTTFTYDAIGQMTSENTTGENYNIATNWTPYGKVDNISITDAAVSTYYSDHTYLYDAMGNQVYDVKANGDEMYYLYDAHNTMLAKYEKQSAYGPAGTMAVKERYVYGTERLMTWYDENTWTTSSTGGGTSYTIIGPPSIDKRQFELHDHLGNVRAVLEARRPTPWGFATPLKYYNYYAFGSPQPYRVYDGGNAHTFGFNGQERKDDYKGKGNHNHALYWEYDTRIGRRWNLDPVDQISISNYAVMGNSPIWHSDVLGDDFRNKNKALKEKTKGELDGAQKDLALAQLKLDDAKNNGDIAKKEIKQLGSQIKQLERKVNRLETEYNNQVKWEAKTDQVLNDFKNTNPTEYAKWDKFNPTGNGILDIDVSSQDDPIVRLDANGFPTGETTPEAISASWGGKNGNGDFVRLRLQTQPLAKSSALEIEHMTSVLIHGLGHINGAVERDENSANQYAEDQYESMKRQLRKAGKIK